VHASAKLTFIYRLFVGFRQKIRLQNSKNNLTKVQSGDKFDYLFLKWISLKLFEVFYTVEKLLPEKTTHHYKLAELLFRSARNRKFTSPYFEKNTVSTTDVSLY